MDSAARTTDLTGRTLAGRYRVVERLAEGGMAIVYRAEQDAEPREVALKVLHPSLAGDARFERRFRREARLASVLDHPNIVRVFDHGSERRLFYLVMELLQGEDVLELLARDRILDEQLAIRIAIGVCRGLEYAHAQGVVHRDLKPENVYVRQRGEETDVKVLDFGIAKILDVDKFSSSDSMPALTVAGSLLGTPEYMCPEQCRGETPGPAGDLYSCGVLLYAMLTGAPPFLAKNQIHVTLMHLRDKPPSPSSSRPGLMPELEAIVLKALAKKPEDRPKSAGELADMLQALLLSRQYEPESPTLPPPAAAPVTPPRPTAAVAIGELIEETIVPLSKPPFAESLVTLDPPPLPPRIVFAVAREPKQQMGNKTFALSVVFLVLVGILALVASRW